MTIKLNQQKSPESAALRANEKKWGKTLMKAGWTAVPNIIFERQQALGLDAMDVNILLHLLSYWWEASNKPHPAVATIASAIGVDRRTIQRRIAAMERDGLIRREERRIKGKGSRTNIYHFDGLIEAAKPFALEKNQEIARRLKEDNARVSRKGRGQLKVIE